MRKLSAVKTNGKKPPEEPLVGCRHAEVCVANQAQQDLKAQLQALSEAVGEGFGRLDARLGAIEEAHLNMAGHIEGIAGRQTTADQREARYYREMGILTRLVARVLGPDAVHELDELRHAGDAGDAATDSYLKGPAIPIGDKP